MPTLCDYGEAAPPEQTGNGGPLQAKQDQVRTKCASLIAGETAELQRINIKGQRRQVKAKS